MATPVPRNQVRFTVAEIARATGGGVVRGNDSDEVCGVAIDSRAVSAGGLFVAIRGGSQDGAAYLPQAAAQGACAVLVHEGVSVPEGPAVIEVADTTFALGELARHHRRRWGHEVIAITGSAGKTTTKELTAAAFTGLGARVLKTQGNLNNRFGVPMTIFCLGPEHDLAVLEVGTSGRGEIARLGQIAEPDVAVVLLAALAHSAGIGTLDDVANEKSSLWGALGANGLAVVNADDPKLMERRRSDVRTLLFGTREGADVRLLSSQLSVEGTHAKALVLGHSLELALPLVGHAAAFDAMAVLACVIGMRGADALEGAVRGMTAVEPTQGRMLVRTSPQGVFVIDDTYNANPKSVALGLETLKELTRERGARSIAVIADMHELGSVSAREHASVGEQAVRLGIDVFVGAGPEMAHATAAAARLSGGRLALHPTRVAHVLSPFDAAKLVRGLLRPGDVVLVKGSRSMAMERVVDALCAAGGRA